MFGLCVTSNHCLAPQIGNQNRESRASSDWQAEIFHIREILVDNVGPPLARSPSNAASIPGAFSRDDGSKHGTRRHLWGGRVLLRRSPPSDRRSWKIPKLRRVVSPAFRGGYSNVVTASLCELSGLF